MIPSNVPGPVNGRKYRIKAAAAAKQHGSDKKKKGSV